jgi:DNA topoisomerase I
MYRLIWQRFVASQMVPAVFDQTTVDIVAKAGRNYNFRVTGSVMKFDGFLKVYEESKEKKDDEDEELKNRLPALVNGQALALVDLAPEEHFTEPKPRFNEASLVKELEERGIGRPSTYATIINTIQEREYVQKVGQGRGAKFVPTEIGFVVTDLLVANFPFIFDPAYTARLEGELDDIEDGKEKWTTLLGAFYEHFEEELEHAGEHMENIKRMEKPTDEKCDVCGSPLVLKWGKFGSFFACSAYNKKDPSSCTFTKENFAAKPEMNAQEGEEQAEEYCEACGRVMVLKRGRFGAFMACPGYSEDPPCKTTRKLTQKQQQKAPTPLDENCPKCGLQLVLRNGQYGEFVSCSGYPKCKYIKQNIIEGMKCPKCGDGDIAERKARRGNLFYGCTNYPKCDFTSNAKPVAEPCPDCGSPYLLEKTRVTGVYLVCPNNRKSAAEDEAPKKRAKKGADAEPEQVACSYQRKIAEPQIEPSVEAMRYQTKAEEIPVA